MLDTDKPVRLRRAPEMRGTITGTARGGALQVAFDGGGTGLFQADDLEQAEDKSWPPADMETKTPRLEVK